MAAAREIEWKKKNMQPVPLVGWQKKKEKKKAPEREN